MQKQTEGCGWNNFSCSTQIWSKSGHKFQECRTDINSLAVWIYIMEYSSFPVTVLFNVSLSSILGEIRLGKMSLSMGEFCCCKDKVFRVLMDIFLSLSRASKPEIIASTLRSTKKVCSETFFRWITSIGDGKMICCCCWQNWCCTDSLHSSKLFADLVET